MTSDPFIADPEPPVAAPDRGAIVYSAGEAHLGVEDALPMLAESGDVYQRKGVLVQVLYSKDAALTDNITRDDNAPVIHRITPGHLWELLSRCCSFQKYDGRSKKYAPCDPPYKVVTAMHGRGFWELIPDLRGVSTVPILREDGSVYTKPGYDAESGLFYAPTSAAPVIPGNPTREDAQEAVADILDVVRDFPFVEPYHRSVWLSTVLAGVARPVIDGGVPMTVIDANTPGTGKSLLVDVASMLVWGTVAAKSPPVRDPEEFRKAITSHLLAGDLLCCIDNMPAGKPVGWQELDNALTAGIWSDRELGRNVRLRLPMTAMWFVTGNNLSICADSARRTLRVRLEAREARPEFRSGFKWDPILIEVARQRPFLLGKALNAVRAYLLAGRPDVGVTPMGSFESWSGIVRNALIWLGMPDPCLGMASVESGLDEEHEARCVLLSQWHLMFDVAGDRELTASQVLEQIERHRGDCRDLIDAIGILCPTRDGSLPNARRLGWTLKSMLHRVHEVGNSNYSLRRLTNKSSSHWYVEIAEETRKPEKNLPGKTVNSGTVEDNSQVSGYPTPSWPWRNGLTVSSIRGEVTPDTKEPIQLELEEKNITDNLDDDDDPEDVPF